MKILFVATEDWFFRSHFVALAHRAMRDGHDVVVAARNSGALANEPFRVVDMPFARRAFGPLALQKQLRRLQEIIDGEKPDIIHAISLKSIGLMMMANARGAGRAFALTGRGYLALNNKPLFASLAGWRFRHSLRRAVNRPRSILVVENRADREWVEGGNKLAEDRVVLMPGAGVDANVFGVTPQPHELPVVVGVVARLIRSKGIDIAVDAVSMLRASGQDIVLRIAGDVDVENPEHISDEELERWRATPGVELVGRINDVSGFWSATHIACLPSRGGEGLPRSLLEAAACGRPIVTSDSAGCRDFVSEDIGFVVECDNVAGFATALAKLAADRALRERMGEQARARVVAAYTIDHASEQAVRAWAYLAR